MKVSLSWLKEYVSIEMPVTQLADALTMVGLEVEAVLNRYAYLDSVLVGRVENVAPHPDADRLKVCRVEADGRCYSVVCGAPNVTAGMTAPLALAGTELPDGTILREGQIRGVASEAMLCSEAELGLGPDGSGIMSLDGNLASGTPLHEALNLSDTVFEIGLTPNRSDCLSIIGIAREIAAIQNTKLRLPEINLVETGDAISDAASVTVNDWDHCPRYSARLLTDLTVGPSPFWLQDRLLSVGQRPINNLVDITNFVMLETGQPLHAFDFDQLSDRKIIVRTAKKGELFTTLDQKQRELADDMLMICDGQKPVGIGGVMGGLNSEVEESTSSVLLESAYFDPTSIRKTSKRLVLNTEASHRFERGVDPEGTLTALDRAAQLMAQLGGGRLMKGAIDERTTIKSVPPILLNVARTNKHLGMSLDRGRIEKLLNSVGFDVDVQDEETLKVGVPSFRVDVFRPEDLMEEVARLEGYNTIPTTFPKIPAVGHGASAIVERRQRVRDLLVGFGFNEVVTYSFISSRSCDRLCLPEDDIRRNQVEILNPLTEDQSVLRTSLIPGLLEIMRHNLSQQIRTVKIFETGRIFLGQKDKDLPKEDEMLGGLWTGLKDEPSWHAKDIACNFYDLKGVLEGLLDGLNIKQVTFSKLPQAQCHYLRHGYSAKVICQNEILGVIGEIRPDVVKNYDLKQTAFIFELNLNRLFSLLPTLTSASTVPRFPSTTRDITLIVAEAIEAAEIIAAIQKLDEPLVESIYIFDVFSGNPIPSGKKSISIRITYRSTEKTLIDEDVNQIHKELTDNLLEAFKASLPT